MTNHEIARAFYATVDAIAAGSSDLDVFDEVAAPGFEAHLPGQGTVTRDGFKAVMSAFGTGFPGAVHEIEDVVAEADRVVARMQWRGTHRGEFQGATPTGREIAMSEMGVMRIEDDRVAEFWPLFDSMALMSAIGAA